MLRHYWVVAMRNAARAPIATIISLLTLSIGFVAALTAYTFVRFWGSAEQHFPDAERVQVLTTSFAFPGGSFARSDIFDTPEHVAERLRSDFPRIEAIARAIVIDRQASVAAGERAVRAIGVGVDPEFLEIFPLPFVAGEPERALSEPRSVVLTAELATRLFGDAEPLGQSVIVGNSIEAVVTGVVGTIPEPSHMGRSTSALLQFDLLTSMDVSDAIRESIAGPAFSIMQRNWFGGNAFTYLLFPDDGSLTPRELERQLEGFVARHVPPEELGPAALSFGLVPVADVLRRSVDAELFSADLGVSVSTVMLLLGVLVLSVAGVNYANLSTARAARRVREVGVRKAVGAKPSQLVAQHLLEAGALSALAAVVAFAILWLASPLLERLTTVAPLALVLEDGAFWMLAVLSVLLITILAGGYPALVLARSNPIEARRSASVRLGPASLFTWLVGVQFAFASLLLIAVIVVSQQSAHVRRTALGEATEPLVLVSNPSRTTGVDPETLRQELTRLPQVEGVTEMSGLPWERLVAQWFVGNTPDGTGARRVVVRTVGHDFFEVMRIPLLAGRAFARDLGADAAGSGSAANGSGSGGSVVVDRAFVEEFGYGSPEEALDALIYVPQAQGGQSPPMRIVGVVENRHFNLRSAGAASTTYVLGQRLDVTVVRLAGSDLAAGLASVDRVWSGLAPQVAISRRFFNELFDQGYRSFDRINDVFRTLSFMAIVIASAGLFGIASLVTSRRVKEIGIRKTQGATAAQITRMLLASFSIPVALAGIVVWPLAYPAAKAYLAVFIDRITLTALPFLVALGATLAIAWLAVAAQTLRAARTAPARVLRHE